MISVTIARRLFGLGSRRGVVSVFGALALFTTLSWGLTSSDLQCSGKLEREIWQAWESNLREGLLEELVRDRLKGRGDTYALYDFQTYTHNLVSMARRCDRLERLREVAALITEAYASLEVGLRASSGRRWICRGGASCTRGNRLLDTEVMLYSVQFLGVAASVANAMATSRASLTQDDTIFIAETGKIALDHLQRWSGESLIQSMLERAQVVREEVKDGSSTLLFTDKPLWEIGIYAEIAGALRTLGNRDRQALEISTSDWDRMRRHYSALIRFFWARVSLRSLPPGSALSGPVADLDRGYWRLYPDNRYAGYAGAEKPVVCTADRDGTLGPRSVVPLESVPLLSDAGWDISHARRLVHVLDALERNRSAIGEIWGGAGSDVREAAFSKAFATNLLANVWNGDTEYPLFVNYWSGANGWYRVAWDNGTGQCREGTAPFGLTASFPAGGYATWSRYQPLIGRLAFRLYALFESTNPTDIAFVERYYPDFAKTAKGKAAALGRLMFLPSLVAVGK